MAPAVASVIRVIGGLAGGCFVKTDHKLFGSHVYRTQSLGIVVQQDIVLQHKAETYQLISVWQVKALNVRFKFDEAYILQAQQNEA